MVKQHLTILLTFWLGRIAVQNVVVVERLVKLFYGSPHQREFISFRHFVMVLRLTGAIISTILLVPIERPAIEQMNK